MNSFVKKTLIFVLVMAVIGVGGWAGRKVYRKSNERRLVADANSYIEKKDFRNAGLCLQRALQINPYNPDACNLMADMLDESGAPSALIWRVRTSQLQTNNVEYRLAWARTALKAGQPYSAAQALRGLDEKTQRTAAFHKLAGALAWDIHDAASAEDQYAAALRLEPTNDTVRLNLATIRLASTNAAVADEARLSLEKISADSPLRLTALRRLVMDAAAHKRPEEAIGFSREIVGRADAAFEDKVGHLELLREADGKEYRSWRSAVENEAKQSPKCAQAFARWMVAKETPANALHWLRALPAAIQTNMPVPLVTTDCEVATKDWSGLLATIDNADWGEAEFYRLLLESLAKRNLGQSLAAKAAWQRSFLLAGHRLDRLTRLGQITGSCDLKAERIEVLKTIVSEFPNERWAADQLVAMYYEDGNTRAIADLLASMYSSDPSDNRLKNNLATINLLRRSNVPKACELAEEAYESAPENPFFISTYAYSLLLQNKPQEAAKVFEKVKAEYLKVPTIAAYYGVVQAEAGNKDAARGSLKRAEAANLLPEEKEMIREAWARL